MTKRTLLFAALLSTSLAAPVFAADTPEEVTSATGPVAGQAAPADHIEGHIAFLKTELKITPDQEGDWDKVAAAMRKDVSESRAADQHYMSQGQPSALDSLSERTYYAELRAQGERRFMEAFKPLYGKLSAGQKQAADELFANDDK
jgi:protein CpxP